jgi:plasmid stabilization system protein ParE
MALPLAWSPEAIEDIEALAGYIERDSPWYAHAVASRIVATAETIPKHPRMGRIVPEIEQEDIRERFVYGFRLIYRIEKKRILLAAIIHGSSTRILQAFVRRVRREKEI